MKIKLNSNMVTGAIFLVISVILHVLIPSQIKTYETGSMTAATVPTLLIRILLACSVILLAQGLLQDVQAAGALHHSPALLHSQKDRRSATERQLSLIHI